MVRCLERDGSQEALGNSVSGYLWLSWVQVVVIAGCRNRNSWGQVWLLKGSSAVCVAFGLCARLSAASPRGECADIAPFYRNDNILSSQGVSKSESESQYFVSSYLVRCTGFMVDLSIGEFVVLYQMRVTGKAKFLLMRKLP